MNKVVIIGRLTATPELKVTQSGTNVCSFTVAVERKFKGADGKPVTDFIDCTAWKHTAEFLCKYFDKGVRVAVSGELQTRTYTDKDGNNRKAVEVVASEVEFADGKAQGNGTPNTTTTVETSNTDDFIPISADDESDLPF